MTEIKTEGNLKTKAMHFCTLHELNKMHVQRLIDLKRIIPEQDVLLSRSPITGTYNILNFVKKGRFDFLVETRQGKTIGIEIMTRPTVGKLKNKLLYANEVDEFVFVLPKNSLEFYLKPKTKIFHKKIRKKFFEKQFNKKNLFAWLLDIKNGQFVEKNQFNKVFNVKK